MDYIDGFVAAVPSANREKYLRHAEAFAEVFKECGATRYVEAWGDDVPTGKTTSFPQAVKLEPGETVVFSWVSWPSTAKMSWARMSPVSKPCSASTWAVTPQLS